MSQRCTGLVFRLNEHGEGPDVIRQVFLEEGWQEFDEDEQDDSDWNMWWKTSRFRKCDYDNLQPWQRLNHFPSATTITRKDSLARNLKRMRGVYGVSAYNFSPIAFNLPNDYTKFVAEYTKQKEKSDKNILWICKPADLSRGRGIFIFRELSELTYNCNAVVQQYVNNPFLISGYKFDLRIYVYVSSFHPIRAYVYEEGLVRFSTEKYDLTCLGNMYAHLTNTSINKHSPSYSSDKERVGPGCKWTISQLRHYFRQSNINDQAVWGKIVNIIVLTLLMQAGPVPKTPGCFELYGFDVMLDENMKPWLLEVNFSPAMGLDCAADSLVKKPMLRDLVSTLDYQEWDRLRGDICQLERPQHSVWQDSLRGPKGSAASHARAPRFPSIRASPQVNQDSDTDEDTAPVIPGCGLPSVQKRSASVQSWASNLYHRQTRSQLLYTAGGLQKKSSIISYSSLSSGSSEYAEPEENSTALPPHSPLRNHVTTRSFTQNRRTAVSPRKVPEKFPSGLSYPRTSVRRSFSLHTGSRQAPPPCSKFPTPPTVPQSQFGGFTLVFPFSDTTNKCSLNNLDFRVVIKECQRLLKQRLSGNYNDVKYVMPWQPL